jgi:hypothetical protein
MRQRVRWRLECSVFDSCLRRRSKRQHLIFLEFLVPGPPVTRSGPRHGKHRGEAKPEEFRMALGQVKWASGPAFP